MAEVDVAVEGRWRGGTLARTLVYPLLWIGCRLPKPLHGLAHPLAATVNVVLGLTELQCRIGGGPWQPIGARPRLEWTGDRYELGTAIPDGWVSLDDMEASGEALPWRRER